MFESGYTNEPDIFLKAGKHSNIIPSENAILIICPSALISLFGYASFIAVFTACNNLDCELPVRH
ncbi:hypothetical protein GV51_0133 [Gardnerella vaginalis 5-1]|nr:hypothetical protein GV51_0133 [Gardnerella vaginalis 5-1]